MDPNAEVILVNFIRNIAANFGCTVDSVDFESRVLELTCPLGNEDACARALADYMDGHVRQPIPSGRGFKAG